MTTPTGKLPQFDGRDVIQSTIAVRKAGDGLSEALNIDPAPFHIGEKVYVVLECEVTAVDHRPVPKTDVLARKHVLTTETATIVDESLVDGVLTAQREALEAARLEAQRKREEEAGVQRVPGTEPWESGGEDDADLPGDGFTDGDDPDDPDGDAGAEVHELRPPDDPDDAAWEAGAEPDSE